jgi:NAD(P)-dependent dehydrogenase (short-subunit alcohol dehydrogenase family)
MTIKSVAIVTGANQGIGQATALRLVRHDLSVDEAFREFQEKAGITRFGKLQKGSAMTD